MIFSCFISIDIIPISLRISTELCCLSFMSCVMGRYWVNCICWCNCHLDRWQAISNTQMQVTLVDGLTPVVVWVSDFNILGDVSCFWVHDWVIWNQGVNKLISGVSGLMSTECIWSCITDLYHVRYIVVFGSLHLILLWLLLGCLGLDEFAHNKYQFLSIWDCLRNLVNLGFIRIFMTSISQTIVFVIKRTPSCIGGM